MPLVARLLLAFVLLLVLVLAGWFTWVGAVAWFSLSGQSCTYGLADWAETYLYLWNGVLILGALIPPLTLALSSKWIRSLIAFGVCALANVGVFLLWFPFTGWLGLCN